MLRDVGYVSELNHGCDRLIELLHEGVKRFEEELEKQDIPFEVTDQPHVISKREPSTV